MTTIDATQPIQRLAGGQSTPHYKPGRVRMGIGVRLLASFLALAVMLGALGIFSVVQLDALNGASAAVTENSMPSIRLLGAFQDEAERFHSIQLDLVLTTDASARAGLESELDQRRQAADTALRAFEPL